MSASTTPPTPPAGLPTPPFTPDRVYRGLPVPYTVPWHAGAERPDFTSVSHSTVQHCLLLDLCGICGKPFNGDKRVWIGGWHATLPSWLWFADPPMHEACARYSLKVCPFLLHQRMRDQDDLPDAQIEDVAPKALYIGKGVVRRGLNTRPAKLQRIERVGPVDD